MSSWTYIRGEVAVTPLGIGQHAKRFVLEEVLAHQPKVWGSEGNMAWDILPNPDHNASCNHDEFGFFTNLSARGWWETQTVYRIFLHGNLRDTNFEDTLRAFSKWMDRLSKRVYVEDMLVRVSGQRKWNWGWGEKIFSGPGHYAKNNPIFWQAEERKRWDKQRYSVNRRYGLDADIDFWAEKLVNLLPGGHRLAMEHDLVHGVCEVEEYLEWNHDKERHEGPDPEVKARLLKAKEDLDRTLAMLDILEEQERTRGHEN